MKKTCLLKILFLLLTLSSFMLIASCKGDNNGGGDVSVKLNTPTVTLTYNTVAWEENTLAERFEIWIDGNTEYVDVSVTTKKLEYNQTFKVRAIGNGETTFDSEWSRDVTCQQMPSTYQVTFVDYDGTVLKQQDVLEGQDATPPNHSAVEGYESDGWDKSYVCVQGNLTITAKYKIKTFNVQFVMPDGVTKIPYINGLGEEKDAQIIQYGQGADMPIYNNVFKEHYWDGSKLYMFTGWDKEFNCVKENMVVTALYSEEYAQPAIVVDKMKTKQILDTDQVYKEVEACKIFLYIPTNYYVYGLQIDFSWKDFVEHNHVSIKKCVMDDVAFYNAQLEEQNHDNGNGFNNEEDMIDNKNKEVYYSWSCGNGHTSSTGNFTVIELMFLVGNGVNFNSDCISFENVKIIYSQQKVLDVSTLTAVTPTIIKV